MIVYRINQPEESEFAQTNAFEEMPSVYRDWEKEVVAGLSPKTEADISRVFSKLLQELTLKTLEDFKPQEP